MKIDKALLCPRCQGTHFTIKREAAYLYTYRLDTPETEHYSDKEEALPFLFDNRERTSDKQYLQCESCHSQFPCDIEMVDSHIDFTILQKAIRSYYVDNPDFLG